MLQFHALGLPDAVVLVLGAVRDIDHELAIAMGA